jgi:hypothetical protein
MNPKINAPAFPPQILLDQFQRPVAPIPGMSQLDHFALQIFCSVVNSYDTTRKTDDCINYSINTAKQLLDELYKAQSETQIETLKIISDETK